VTAIITVCWVVALFVLLIARTALPVGARWWIWTCATGVVMGLFGLWYVPFLKGRRARLAALHERHAEEAGEKPEEAGEKQGSPADGQSPGPRSSGPASGYVSRENGSNTVSSTETPGRSTRS
jgi:hypothetical protein